jgi:hypothetical protein
MPFAPQDELSLHLQRERDMDRAAAAFREHETRRHAGAGWSGLSCGSPRRRSEPELRQAALARLTAARTWRDDPEGRFLVAMAAVQRAAAELHAGAEQARAGASRGLDTEYERCARLVANLRCQARALAQGLREAARALDRTR